MNNNRKMLNYGKVRVQNTSDMGNSVFASVDFQPGDWVTEMKGVFFGEGFEFSYENNHIIHD